MKTSSFFKGLTRVLILALLVTLFPVGGVAPASAAGSPVLPGGGLFPIDLTQALTWSSTVSIVGESAHAAVDGNIDTKWVANGPSFPQSLMVDLGKVKVIAKINTLFEQAGTWRYEIFTSLDGENWASYGQNPSSVPKQQSYTNEKDAAARYVAITMTTGGLDPNGDPCWASIREFDVVAAEPAYMDEIYMVDSAVRFLGRYEINEDGGAQLFFESGIKVGFTGSTIGVDLTSGGTGGGFAYSIDNAPYEEQRMAEGQSGRYTLVDNLADGEHTLRLYNRYQDARMTVNSLFLGEGGSLVAPADTPTIEFVGDSITAGYYGGPINSGLVHAYPWKTAALLGLDFNTVAYSGITLMPGSGSDPQGMAARYFQKQEYKQGETSEPWDSTKYQPDYIVMNLTQNDSAADSLIRDKYTSVLSSVYGVNPDATIFVVAPFSGKYRDVLRDTVTEFGNEHVHFVNTAGWLSGTEYYDGLHPSDAGSDKAARLLAAALQPYIPEVSALNTGADLSRVQLDKQAQGNHLALNKPAAATSVTPMVGFGALAALDSNPDTRWCAEDMSMPQAFMVDLGSPEAIRNVYVNFEQSSDWDFVLETSLDGVTWTQYAAIYESDKEFFLEGNQLGRYVRITVNDSTGGAWASIWDFDVYVADEDGGDASLFKSLPAPFTGGSSGDSSGGSGSGGSGDGAAPVTPSPAVETPDLSKLDKIDLSGAVAISSADNGLGASAGAAFDGDPHTRWAANGPALPQTLTVDLGATKNIAKVNTFFEQPSTWEYKIRYSVDGATWQIYAEKTGGVIKHQSYTDEKNVEARYVSIEITGAGLDPNGENCWASIWEFEVIERDTGKNLALNRPASATSTIDPGASAAAAFDNNPETRWTSDGPDMPQTLMADMGSLKTIRNIYINFEQSSDWDFVLETSLNGVTWTPYAAKKENGQKFYLEGNQPGRFVRITVNGSTGGAWASIWDLDVYTDKSVIQAQSFSDVKPGDWYYDAVSFVADRGIVSGIGGGKFAPNANVKRGDFLLMIMRAYVIKPDQTPVDNFADAGSTYYTNYLSAAKRLNLVNGVGNNRFNPEGTISRQDMAVILYTILENLGKLPSAANEKTVDSFTDGAQTAQYARDALSAFNGAGIINGDANGLLTPAGTSTRAQVAMVLYTLLK